MLPFELFCGEIKLKEGLSENLNILKNELLDTVTSSCAKIKSWRIKSNRSGCEAKQIFQKFI